LGQKDYIAGLDVGTTKVCCVLAEVDADTQSVDIIGVGLVPCSGLRRGVVVDLDTTTQAIEGAVEAARRMAGSISIRSVNVGVTGEHITSLNSRGIVAITSPDREVSQADVERAIENSRVIVLPPEQEIIHAIPRKYVVDGQDGIKDPVGMSGSRLEVETHIITGKSTFLDNVMRCVGRAGLAVESTTLEPIATSEAVLIEGEKDIGVAMVDVGGGTTDLAVYTEGEIAYTAVIPIGGRSVTNDIAIGLRAAFEDAEKSKLQYGCAMLEQVGDEDVFEISRLGLDEPDELPREMLTKIIEPRMREILEIAGRELEKSGALLPGGVVLTGGGSLLPGSVELATQVLNLPTRLGTPRNVGGLSDTVNSPVHATAVGLVGYAARQRPGEKEQRVTRKVKRGLLAWLKRLLG
jgi:cell division protein FtsA